MHKTKKIVAPLSLPSCFLLVALGVLFFFLLLPHSFAAETVETDIGTFRTWTEYVSGIWRWGAQIIFGIAIIAIVVGGLLLVGSGGNEDKADIGRQTIRGGIIATIIVLFSAVFNRFIQNPVSDTEATTVGGLQDSLQSAATGLLSVVGALSALGIVYAGIKYMKANGEEEKLQSAKRAFVLSVTGLGISVSAWVISGFLFRMFGA